MAVRAPVVLPTTLPTTKTTVIDYGLRGYTSTIPTEFGLLTKVTGMNLMQNYLTGAIPTELGMLDQMSSRFLLDSNSMYTIAPMAPPGFEQCTALSVQSSSVQECRWGCK